MEEGLRIEVPTPAEPVFRSTAQALSPTQVVERGLWESNLAACGEPFQPLKVLLRSEGGVVRGGALGMTGLQALFLESMWIAEDIRQQGWGRRLLERAEQEALRRGCDLVRLSTHTFQAPGFYQSLGYQEVARIQLAEPHHELFFVKELSTRASA